MALKRSWRKVRIIGNNVAARKMVHKIFEELSEEYLGDESIAEELKFTKPKGDDPNEVGFVTVKDAGSWDYVFAW